MGCLLRAVMEPVPPSVLAATAAKQRRKCPLAAVGGTGAALAAAATINCRLLRRCESRLRKEIPLRL